MSVPHGKLSPSEFEIMEALWANQVEFTVTDVLQAVNARRQSPLKRATIQVQLRRLEDKGWLSRREDGRKFYYLPTAGREAASADLARDLTERVFDGSCAELVRCLFKQNEVTLSEIERIRALLDEASGENKRTTD